MQKLIYKNLDSVNSQFDAEVICYYKDFFSQKQIVFDKIDNIANNSLLLRCLLDSKMSVIASWIKEVSVYQNSLFIKFNKTLDSLEKEIAENEILEIIHRHFQSGLSLFEYYNDILDTTEMHNPSVFQSLNLNDSENFFVIDIEPTPNPYAFKFNINKEINGDNTYYASIEDAQNSELARRIFEVPSVKAVFFGSNFITITNFDLENQKNNQESIVNIIQSFSCAIDKNENLDDNYENLTEVEKEIVYILNTYIKPGVEQDGGSIIFKKFVDGIVTLELRGACSGCPSSSITLKNGIENTLKFYIPSVTEVVAY